MRYFIAESVMNDDLPVTPEQMEKEYLPQHIAYLQQAIGTGMLLMAGPGESGGFLILRAETRETVDAFLENEPYRRNGFNRFVVKEFIPKDRAEIVKDW